MVRIGFVGTGGIATHHLEQLRKVEGAQVAALCDVLEARAQEAAGKFGGKSYTDYRKMLDTEALDALYVCIPPFAHSDAEILAARKGVHLFVEKPVVLDVGLGLRINAEIQKAGVMSSVGYSLRYTPAAGAMRAFLHGKTIAMVTSNRWGGVPGTPWWRVMAQSGGQLVEQTTHQVDLMRYLAGEIVEVHARYAQRVIGDLENATIPDVQVATFQFASGAVGAITTSCALTKGGGQSDLTVVLRDMSVRYGKEVTVSPAGAASIPVSPDPTPDIDASFVRAIQTGDRSLIRSSYEDGLKSAAACLAANESAETGKPVKPWVG
jgi:predicted dehydrogenase